MNPLHPDIWQRGLAYPQYRRRIGRNQAVFDEVFAAPDFTPEDLEVLRQLPPLRVLAIGEDWCPDVYHTLPTWARVAEELPGWELRVFPRDAHPDVMAHFLWKKGALRIPVFAFYDERGYLQAWWSGRSAPAQQALDTFLAGRPFASLSEADKKAAGDLLQTGYRESFRRANFAEILALLRAFHHV
jgi:thioredoxin family protein